MDESEIPPVISCAPLWASHRFSETQTLVINGASRRLFHLQPNADTDSSVFYVFFFILSSLPPSLFLVLSAFDPCLARFKKSVCARRVGLERQQRSVLLHRKRGVTSPAVIPPLLSLSPHGPVLLPHYFHSSNPLEHTSAELCECRVHYVRTAAEPPPLFSPNTLKQRRCHRTTLCRNCV